MKDLEQAILAARRLRCASAHYLENLTLMDTKQISILVNNILLNATNKPLSMLDDVITVLSYIHNFNK